MKVGVAVPSNLVVGQVLRSTPGTVKSSEGFPQSAPLPRQLSDQSGKSSSNPVAKHPAALVDAGFVKNTISNAPNAEEKQRAIENVLDQVTRSESRSESRSETTPKSTSQSPPNSPPKYLPVYAANQQSPQFQQHAIHLYSVTHALSTQKADGELIGVDTYA